MYTRLFVIACLAASMLLSCAKKNNAECMTGAFVADRPTAEDIKQFAADFGKKPRLVMVFLDWGDLVHAQVIADVTAQGCTLFVTLEPWDAQTKGGIDFDGLIQGNDDGYLADLARQLAAIRGDVFFRFAHEMNGNWYPWCGAKVGREKYIGMYRHVKDIFVKEGAANVRWVFSVNWEDVPRGKDNIFSRYYPGDDYVDYIGIDGYNWGSTQPWSRWMSFQELFQGRYDECGALYPGKPVLISEFACAGSGGNKAAWITEAFGTMKRMDRVRGFVIFNIDKEVDWRCVPGAPSGKALKQQLEDPYFR